MWPVLFQKVSCLAFNVHFSCDGHFGYSFTESELAWFLMCTLLVTETMACLVSVGEFTWFLLSTPLVTEIMTCLVSGCELPGSNIHSFGDRDWPILFQKVSWPDFQCALI